MNLLRPEELQALLNAFEPLKHTQVGWVSPAMPQLLRISGLVQIKGQVRAYETDVDTTTIENAEDVIRLAGNLIQSFEDAAEMIPG